MSELIKVMVDNVDQKIGNKPFYSTRELVTAGVFGSISSARRSLRAGHLPYIRITERRFVILRSTLLSFLESNFGKSEVDDY